MELQHLIRRTCIKQPGRVDRRKCGQQAWRSTSFADTTIDLRGEIFRVWDKVPEGSAIRPILEPEGTRILLSQSVG